MKRDDLPGYAVKHVVFTKQDKVFQLFYQFLTSPQFQVYFFCLFYIFVLLYNFILVHYNQNKWDN